MSDTWISVRTAFRSWGTIIGIFVASLTGFNILRKVMRIGLSQLFSDLLAAYQHLIHEPVLWVSRLLHLPTPDAWVIDAALLWLLVGGIVLRSVWPIRVSVLTSKEFYRSADRPEWFDRLFDQRWLLPVFLVAFLALWPVFAPITLREPHVFRKTELKLSGRFSFEKLLARHSKIRTSTNRGHDTSEGYVGDMRVVFAAQAIAAVACIGAWVAANILVKLYVPS